MIDTTRFRLPILLPTLLGGIGGAINGLIHFLNQEPPKPPSTSPDSFLPFLDFDLRCPWTIIPVGLLHGALLAAIAILAVNLTTGRRFARIAAPLFAGYIAGWISFIPVLALALRAWSWELLIWPVDDLAHHRYQFSDSPFEYFGLVTLILSAVLLWTPHILRRSLPFLLGAGAISGILGSFWFWTKFDPLVYSFIHGTVWGLLVGFGLWWGQRRSPAQSPTPHA